MTESPSPASRAPSRTARSRPPARRRSPIATATRVAALGIGGTTMFGLTAALAMADDSATGTESPAQPASQPIVVRLHSTKGATSTGLAPDATSTSTASRTESASGTALEPVELRAQPVVETIDVQAAAPPADAAPVARTNGSR